MLSCGIVSKWEILFSVMDMWVSCVVLCRVWICKTLDFSCLVERLGSFL